jgi:hypothetical protein
MQLGPHLQSKLSSTCRSMHTYRCPGCRPATPTKRQSPTIRNWRRARRATHRGCPCSCRMTTPTEEQQLAGEHAEIFLLWNNNNLHQNAKRGRMSSRSLDLRPWTSCRDPWFIMRMRPAVLMSGSPIWECVASQERRAYHSSSRVTRTPWRWRDGAGVWQVGALRVVCAPHGFVR